MPLNPATKVARLKSKLSGAAHGGVACDALNTLGKLAQGGEPTAFDAIAEYAEHGSIGHMRTHACSILSDKIPEHETRFARVFEKLLDDPLTRYWAIPGLLRSRGSSAYPRLVEFAL